MRWTDVGRGSRRGWAGVALALLALTGCEGIPLPTVGGQQASPPARTHTEQAFRITFDEARSSDASQLILDDGRAAVLNGAYGGGVEVVETDGRHGSFARLPGPCTAPVCPRAQVRVNSDAELNPGLADFSFGARLRLRPAQVTKGANVVQKGRYGADGGQWKLQVDTASGTPSCVIQGTVGERRVKAYVAAAGSIADGDWHEVSCHRVGHRLSIEVDGASRATETEMVVGVENDSPVVIGSSGLRPTDDQYHGEIDSVFLRVHAGPEH